MDRRLSTFVVIEPCPFEVFDHASPDAYGQTVDALRIIAAALVDAGSSVADVVRTRIYVVDINDADAVLRAHGEVFGDVRPAATLVQVVALIDPLLRVEIEADAVAANA